MPKKRKSKGDWDEARVHVLKKANWRCERCSKKLTPSTSHIDHIKSGKLGSNHFKNLRALCQKCHILRKDFRHRGMIGCGLKKGLIPSNWRDHLWG